MIHFVGAGPGAPDLITVRGKTLIERADVIIYAGSLVNPQLLSYAREGCRVHNSAHLCLEEVIALMEEAEKAGLETVRLHTGDPSVYGAIREQMDALDARGIAYDICPGVSSAFAAAASLGAEFTLPGVSQTLIMTRMEGRTPVPPRESIESLAVHRASMAIFLSVSMAGELAQRLIAGGYPPQTRAAVVYRASWPDETVRRGTVAELGELCRGIEKTAMIVVGDFLGDDYELSKLYDKNFTTGYRKGGER